MEVSDAVRTVLAVRDFQNRPVPDQLVRRIVEAGHLSASSMNLQPWHFIVVQDPETLKRLGKLARTGPYIAKAPLAIAVLVERTRFAVSDASRAVQSMALVAWAEGVGSNWVGFGGLDEMKAVLGVPEELDILAVVPFGYPTSDLGLGRKKRKPLETVASSEHYGQPYK